MKLLVGLGNPGAKYAEHRHNVGFMALDAIIARHNLGPTRRRFQGDVAEGDIAGTRVIALKPQTYMNESGRSAGEAARYYKIGLEDVIVLHDEIDLAEGKVRVRRGGGLAGHNGLRSLAQHLGPDFTRVRIGIGHPGAKEKVQHHVLGNFAKADRAWLDPLLEAIADNAGKLVEGDAANFMNALANATQPSESSSPERTSSPKRGKPSPKSTSGLDRPKTPSQRDLARAGARGGSRKPQSAPQRAADDPSAGTGEPAERAGGPFALLRRLLGGTSGADRD